LIFDENQKPIRVYGSYQDVTERRSAEERERELERKLMHSQKLEALGTLAGGIAHDLNNTLMPIMALSKVTARQLELGSALRENLETIFAASEQARDLVKRVLAFSRQEKVEKKPARLQGIVSEALPLLRATIPTSIQLETRIGEVPPTLADASQIHQVITNLVTNAAHAIGSDMGGVITITLDEVSGLTPRGTIRLSVIDTGESMNEATQRRIFEPFFTTKQVGQGTGLGLSIIESIVADHGGSIEVRSAPGRGTRFDIYFPLPSAATSAAA
jgi:signal transduction histidine kinase